MRKIKFYLGAIAIAAIALVNMQVLMDDSTTERLLMLNDVEALATDDWFVMNAKEMRSYQCDGGSYYDVCESADPNRHCDEDKQIHCPVGEEENENNTTPGDSATIKDDCLTLGHNYSETPCFKQCLRCGISFNLCDD